MKEISIIMLAHNRPILMIKAIESILNQVGVDFEFVLVDKAIDEKTHQVCIEYISKYPEIKYVKIPPGTIGVGRNAGIEAAVGEYITFVDDDDYFESDMLYFLLSNARKIDADISICGCNYDFEGDIRPYYVYQQEYILDKREGVVELLKRKKYNSANPCKLFRSKLFEDVRYPEDASVDDIRTIYKLFANADRIIVSGLPKYFFLKHGDNNSAYIESNRYTDKLLYEYLEAFAERTEYLLNKIPEAKNEIQYSVWSYMLSMIRRKYDGQIIGCDQAISQMEDDILEEYQTIMDCKLLTEIEKQMIGRLLGLQRDSRRRENEVDCTSCWGRE